MSLTIQRGERVLIKGDTFPLKEEIKAVGGTWDPKARTWSVPKDADLTAVLAKHEAEKERVAGLYKEHRAAWRPSPFKNRGPCCQAATPFTQYDVQGAICYRCKIHGDTINSYTGD